MSMTITTPAVTTRNRTARSTTSLRRATFGVGLVATHDLAAAIIVPVLARHAND